MMKARTARSKIWGDKKHSAIVWTTTRAEFDRRSFAKSLKSSGNLFDCGLERNVGDK
jgi:hypothetical protein